MNFPSESTIISVQPSKTLFLQYLVSFFVGTLHPERKALQFEEHFLLFPSITITHSDGTVMATTAIQYNYIKPYLNPKSIHPQIFTNTVSYTLQYKKHTIK